MNKVCDACGSPIKTVPAGVSKKTGKPYSAFEACSNRECNWKPLKSDLNASGRSYSSTNDVRDDVSRSHLNDAQSRVESSIGKTLDRKEQGMIYFASLREAGNYMTSMWQAKGYPDQPDDYYKEFWNQQRRFYKEITEDPQR